MSHALAARGITKRYGSKAVLDGVDLTVEAGEAVALVGENGAGKSTLLRICAGVLRADAGTVSTRGRVGYCPQDPGLLDRLRADEHLELFGAAFGMRRAEAIRRGRDLLAELHFPEGETAQAVHLSGGNRQKLNVALALLGDPQVLLLDEPYQGFDHGTYVDFWHHVRRWRGEGKGVVVVTHLLADLDLVDRIVDISASRLAGAAPR
jgi:ABC-2 type transport system ATP-binding protein